MNNNNNSRASASRTTAGFGRGGPGVAPTPSPLLRRLGAPSTRTNSSDDATGAAPRDAEAAPAPAPEMSYCGRAGRTGSCTSVVVVAVGRPQRWVAAASFERLCSVSTARHRPILLLVLHLCARLVGRSVLLDDLERQRGGDEHEDD